MRLSLLAGLFAAALLLLGVLYLVVSPSAEARADPARGEASALLDLEVVRARLASLEREKSELIARLDALEQREPRTMRAPVTSVAPGAHGGPDVEELRRDIDALTDRLESLTAKLDARLGAPASAGDPIQAPAGFKNQVASAMEEIRREELEEQLLAKQEAQRAEIDDRVEQLGEWLQLTPYQSTGMRDAVVAQYDRNAELLRLWQAGASDEDLGERKRENRDVHRAEVEALLSADQFEAYWDREGW